MLGPDYSTKFSPWLASGSISPRLIDEEVGSISFSFNDDVFCIFEGLNYSLR